MTPQGQEFIWCLVRGSPQAELAEGEDYAEDAVFCVDGSCRVCSFPLLQSTTTRTASGSYELSCGLCGTSYDLATGEVTDFLPARNPVQFASKLANEKKGPQRAASLPTRVSRSGNVYIRLPDGTLKSKLPAAA